MIGILLALVAIQGPRTTMMTPPPGHGGPISATAAVAVRSVQAPVIDGKDDDPIWRQVRPITDFVEWQPTEGAPARFRTEAKVAYDAANLYVFVRAYDPHPDSIIRVLARRDSFTPSDMVWLFVDSYHDHRTGYEFGVNAAGVKIDQAVYDDGNEDGAWDGVWDVATRIDSLGWTAEFRIPLSQLRYSTAQDHTFGFTVDRDIYRYNERVSWPAFSQAKPGLISQLGHLEGLDGLEAPRRLEATPYTVARNASEIRNNGFTRGSSATLGGDLKYRVASNLTLDATINPDFGQVEADPAVLNLTAYETFFSERRPFFVAGRGLFQMNVNCTAVNDCNTGEGLYYSRRIGRTPQLAGTYNDTTPQQPTTILGAGKLLGRFPGGLTVGTLEAMTGRATLDGSRDTTIEPSTSYTIVRARQDLANGNSQVGGMFTAVNRSMDAFTSPYLHRSAYAGALDFRHRVFKNNYELSGQAAVSQVAGSPAAILATQTDAVHYYQRPDAALPLDSTHTSLGGDAEELHVAKVGGQHLLFQSAYVRRSPGFEVNDLGYIQRADQQSWSTWAGYFDRHQRKLYNRFQWNNNWWMYWTTGGLPLEAAYNSNIHVQFRNNWWLHLGGTYGQLGASYDDRAARGGPAVRVDHYLAPWLGINGDDRKSLVPYLWVNLNTADGGRSHSVSLQPELDWKLEGRITGSVSGNWTRNINDTQWYGNYTDSLGVVHYTFAHLRQTTVGVTLRLNYTFTPDLSLQIYAQPFVSKGSYTNVRQLSADPRAARYDDRYAAYGDTSVTLNPGGFNFKEFQSNVVFRWEYSPGSTLFVVWNQGRVGSLPSEGTDDYQGDMRNLFRLHPMNTFLVKVAYWINR